MLSNMLDREPRQALDLIKLDEMTKTIHRLEADKAELLDALELIITDPQRHNEANAVLLKHKGVSNESHQV